MAMASPPRPSDAILDLADHELLSAAKRGDAAAFTLLVRRHERLVHGYLRARLATAADLDDLCQEVFVRLYTGRTTPAERATAGLRPWILGIARNVLREHGRAAKRREHAWTELCLEIESRAEADGADAGRFDEAIARLPGCLDGLGPSARQAIDLYYGGGGARLRDVAMQMKRSEGAMKLLVHRARQAVKRCLETPTAPEATL